MFAFLSPVGWAFAAICIPGAIAGVGFAIYFAMKKTK